MKVLGYFLLIPSLTITYNFSGEPDDHYCTL